MHIHTSYVLDHWWCLLYWLALLWSTEWKQIWLKQRLNKFLCTGTCPPVMLRALRNHANQPELACSMMRDVGEEHVTPSLDKWSHHILASPVTMSWPQILEISQAWLSSKEMHSRTQFKYPTCKFIMLQTKCLCPRQNSYVEALTSNVTVVRDRAFTKVIKFKWGHKVFG